MSEEKRDINMAAAKEEIEQILLKYNVVLIPVIIHQGENTISRIDIAPVSEQLKTK
jgi:hypothetical protein